jgi:FkbH-like protein
MNCTSTVAAETATVPIFSAATQDRSLPLASSIHVHRAAVAEVFARAATLAPRWRTAAAATQDGWSNFVEREFAALADYLALYYESGDGVFIALLLGEKIKALYDPDISHDERRLLAREMASVEASGIASVLRDRIDATSLRRVEQDLLGVGTLLSTKAARETRILLIGDCLFLDVVPFLVGDLLARGVGIEVEYATSKNTALLLEELRARASLSFDLVFYSPFTYEFSPAFAALTHWRKSLMSGARISEAVDLAWNEVERVLQYLTYSFDCPIYVHNTSALIREADGRKRAAKLWLTRRARLRARHRANALIAESVAAKNASSYKHLFVLDEDAIVRSVGEWEAGRYLHWSPLQHPAVLGRILAQSYVDRIFVDAFLAKRKLVVCDLDNTLWAGVIGEGPVEHEHHRQRLLKGLKDRGVVLAVNSKNDPSIVHWRGGTLQESDFVFAAVSWEPKAHGMSRIRDALNLKTKDFVFVDDREDELALMKAAHPEVLCLNATDPATWRRIALWYDRLDEHPDMDRTLMYRQRDERDAFARDGGMLEEDKQSLFADLQLSVEIERVTRAGLKRFAELINRTSQFNLEGSRVTYREVCGWHDSPSHLLLSAKSADRFGEMGTTCVAAARIDGSDLRLLPFVLSCRVFGYGIETAVMNELKAFAARRGLARIVGRYVASAQNAPCKDFLAQSGFQFGGKEWSFAVDSSEPVAPAWLRVSSRVQD